MSICGSVAVFGVFLVALVDGYFHSVQQEPPLKVSGQLKRYERGPSSSFRIEFILVDFHDTERRHPVSGKLCGNSTITSCVRPQFYATVDTKKLHPLTNYAFSDDQTRSDFEFRLKKGLSGGPVKLGNKSIHKLCTSDLEPNQPVNIRVHVLERNFGKAAHAQGFIDEFICLLPGFTWLNDKLVLEKSPTGQRLVQKLNCLAVHRPGRTRLTYRWTAFSDQEPTCDKP